jgi:hypothetical protein
MSSSRTTIELLKLSCKELKEIIRNEFPTIGTSNKKKDKLVELIQAHSPPELSTIQKIAKSLNIDIMRGDGSNISEAELFVLTKQKYDLEELNETGAGVEPEPDSDGSDADPDPDGSDSDGSDPDPDSDGSDPDPDPDPDSDGSDADPDSDGSDSDGSDSDGSDADPDGSDGSDGSDSDGSDSDGSDSDGSDGSTPDPELETMKKIAEVLNIDIMRNGSEITRDELFERLREESNKQSDIDNESLGASSDDESGSLGASSDDESGSSGSSSGSSSEDESLGASSDDEPESPGSNSGLVLAIEPESTGLSSDSDDGSESAGSSSDSDDDSDSELSNIHNSDIDIITDINPMNSVTDKSTGLGDSSGNDSSGDDSSGDDSSGDDSSGDDSSGDDSSGDDSSGDDFRGEFKLRDRLSRAGVNHNELDKSELDSTYNSIINGKCDSGQECSDGLICDADSGVCLSEKDAYTRKNIQTMRNNFDEFIYNGKKIIGSTKAIDKLKSKLGMQSNSTTNRPLFPSNSSMIPDSPLPNLTTQDAVIQCFGLDTDSSSPGSLPDTSRISMPVTPRISAPVTTPVNIENLLERIASRKEHNISEFDEAEQSILRCFGLTSK